MLSYALDLPPVLFDSRRQAGGAACARNTGAAQSTGDLLYFLDGDDLFYPPHLHACYVVSEEGKYYVKTAMHLCFASVESGRTLRSG